MKAAIQPGAETLLVELFTEELPPRALQRLAEAFAGAIASQLQAHGLTAPDSAAEIFCTPRRLAVSMPGVPSTAAAREVQVKGPSIAVALDAQGQPTMALRKWAEKQGAPLDALARASDGKQECFYYRSMVAGKSLAGVIQPVIAQAIARLPIPKLMSYQLGDGVTTVSFVRPAHRLVVLHGSEVLPCEVLGLAADRLTEGHRFQSDGPIRIESAISYPAQLHDQGRVVASFDKRRDLIAAALNHQCQALGATLAGNDAEQSAVDALLDEVTALVEWPAVYVGRFEDSFLQVPQECLILTMRTNQKYFPLFDAEGRLLPSFLIVSNMEVADPSSIIDGNERVVRPRLADARFFYDQDRKTPLHDRVARLAHVVYHAKLGSQADRTRRVVALAGAIARALGQDPAPAERAGMLAKADLLTGMVGEFPELQGIMGRYYARHDGEPEAVSLAIAEHYQPRFAGDSVPQSKAGTTLALADKLETLAGIWGIGQRPTGEKDPFALRRHGLGVIRMLIEKPLPLGLQDLVARAFGTFDGIAGFEHDAAGLHGFLCDRLRNYLRERGFEATDIDAVLAVDSDRLDRIENRLVAVAEFRQLPEFESLAAANKRIANILRKSAAPGAGRVRTDLFTEPAEGLLHDALLAAEPVVNAHLDKLDFTRALQALAGLRGAVDAFFDQVMVNAPEPDLRDNRLALLDGLRRLMNRVADLSQL